MSLAFVAVMGCATAPVPEGTAPQALPRSPGEGDLDDRTRTSSGQAVDLSTLISSTQADEIATILEARYGQDRHGITVVAIDMTAVTKIVGDQMPADGVGAIAFAVGDYVDTGAKSPVGASITGRTAFVVVLPDGTLLGGGLYVDDLSASISAASLEMAPLSELATGS